MIKTRLRVLADENIPHITPGLTDIADVIHMPGRLITANDLAGVDALLIRSVTSVNAELLANADRLSFVGSCTIGVDHVDQSYLTKKGIRFAFAPGCNAPAVVDYVLAALVAIRPSWFETGSSDKTFGIIGLGAVGKRLRLRLQAMGVQTLAFDPWVDEATHRFDQVLGADVISLHVPLTHANHSPFPTYHLIDAVAMERIKPGALLINTSRGAVVDNQSLLEQLQRKAFSAVLDVYEDEPEPQMSLLQACDIATAHIAGYSVQGKARGTQAVLEALADHFNSPSKPIIDMDRLTDNPMLACATELRSLIKAAYDIKRDSRRFITAYEQADDKAVAFDRYRKHYMARHEFSYQRVSIAPAIQPLARACGFSVDLG